MDELSHAHGHQPRSEAETLFGIEVAVAELIIATEDQSRTLIARLTLLETTTMTKLADIATKLDQLDTMLSAKAASDDADLTAVGAQIDGIIEKHTDAPATTTTTTVAAIDPATGLPVT